MVQHITKEDILNPTVKEILELAKNIIKEKLSDKKHELELCLENRFFHKDIILDEEEQRDLDTEIPEAENYIEERLDGLLGENVILKHNNHTVKSKIMKRAIEPDGKPIGKYNHNPILDSRRYEVELPNGEVDEYCHNIHSGNLISQFDKEAR